MTDSTVPVQADQIVHSALPRIAMIGVGSMGGAILAGLRSPAVQVDGPIAVTTGSAASAAKFDGAEDVVAYSQESDPEANRKAVRGARVVILAVKPWMIHDVLRDIADDLEPGTVVASTAAGVTIASMEAELPEHISVVRSMPNTPAKIGKGVTGVAGGTRAREEDIDLARRVFETVGSVLVTGEDRIDAVCAMSGSGPAYIFYFAEELTAAVKRLGFSDDEAKLLAQGTVAGAAALMEQSDVSPAQLRENVTSPQGTTEQSLKVLQAANWADLFDRTFEANIRRARELAGE